MKQKKDFSQNDRLEIQNAMAKPQQSAFQRIQKIFDEQKTGTQIILIRAGIQDAGLLQGLAQAILDPTHPDHPNHVCIILIRARIQGPKLPRSLARESWILDPGPNQNDSEIISCK